MSFHSTLRGLRIPGQPGGTPGGIAPTPDPGLTALNRKLSAGGDFGTIFQKDIIAATRPIEEGFEAQRRRFETDVGQTEQERGRLRSGLSSALAQKFQTVQGGGRRGAFAGNLEQLTRKAKARSQIANRGESAIANQQLKDRLTLAREKITRTGILSRALGQSARIRTGLDTARLEAKSQVGAAIGGALGSIAGGLTRGLQDKFGSTVDPELDQGTATADFFLRPDAPQPGFDFETEPTVFG